MVRARRPVGAWDQPRPTACSPSWNPGLKTCPELRNHLSLTTSLSGAPHLATDKGGSTVAALTAYTRQLLLDSRTKALEILEESEQRAENLLQEAKDEATRLLLAQQTEAASLLASQVTADEQLIEGNRLAASALVAASETQAADLQVAQEDKATQILATAQREAAAILLDAQMRVADMRAMAGHPFMPGYQPEVARARRFFTPDDGIVENLDA